MRPEITYPVTLSKHGKSKAYNKQTLAIIKFINDNWEHIIKGLHLPDKIHILLRPIPKYRFAGQYNHSKTLVILDVTQSFRNVIKILLHELRHAHQHMEGTLQHVLIGNKYVSVWEDQYYRPRKAADKNYNNQPWEVDANNFADAAIVELEKEIGPIFDGIVQ